MFRLPVLDINKVHVVRARLIVPCGVRMAAHVAPIQNTISICTYKQVQCTPSPFVNAGTNDGKTPQRRRNSINLPTLCNDEMTQAVISLVGPGYYEADAGSSYAELKLANDGDTITCNATWDHATTPGIFTTHVYITVRA